MSTDRPAGTVRGGTIAFNFLHPDGRVVDERCVDRAHSLSLRTGCFCHPRAGEVAFSLSTERLDGGFDEGMILDDYLRLIGMRPAARSASRWGIATYFADVRRFMEFATEFVDLTDVPADLPPRLAC